MNATAARATLAAALSSLGASACGAGGGGGDGGVLDAGTADEQRWDGRLVTVTSSEGIRPCGGTVDFLDRFFAHNFAYWTGIPPGEGVHVSIDLRRGDTVSQSGHAKRTSAWAGAQDAVLHETSHLFLLEEDGGSAPALTEGSAEAFGTGQRSYIWMTPYESPSEFLWKTSDDVLTSGDYIAAGQFFSFLVHRYGIEAARTAYRSAPADSSSGIEASLVGVFGDDLYQAMDDFMTAPPCPLQAWECDGDILPVVHLPFEVDREPSCEQPGSDLLGFVADDDDKWFPMTMVTLELGPGDTTFEVEISDNVAVSVEPCLHTCGQPVPFYLPGSFLYRGGSPLFATYPEGRYFLRIVPVDVTKPFSVSMREAPPPRRR